MIKNIIILILEYFTNKLNLTDKKARTIKAMIIDNTQTSLTILSSRLNGAKTAFAATGIEVESPIIIERILRIQSQYL